MIPAVGSLTEKMFLVLLIRAVNIHEAQSIHTNGKSMVTVQEH